MDVDYRRLVARIEAVNDATNPNEDEDAHIAKIRKWIQGNNHMNYVEHARNKERRYEGTCEWLFKSEKFRRWLADDVDAIPALWLHGKAGAGKSTLCSVAIEYVQEKKQRSAVFFFLNFKSQPSRLQLLKDLACQLLDVLAKQVRRSTRTLRLFLKFSGDEFPYVESMVQELLSLVSPVFIFIDGLNEVGGLGLVTGRSDAQNEIQAVDSFLKFLMGEAHNAEKKVRLWCSSQYAEPATAWMEGFSLLPVDEDAVSDDVNNFIRDGIISKLLRTGKSLDACLSTALALYIKAKGNFRWASLMIDSVNRCTEDEDMIARAERGLPGDLNDYYAECLTRLKNKDLLDERESGVPTRLSRYERCCMKFDELC